MEKGSTKMRRRWEATDLDFSATDCVVETRLRFPVGRFSGVEAGMEAAASVFERRVSGSTKTSTRSVMLPYITRNHCVLRQPSSSASTPPRIGAKSGPQRGPK